MELLKFFIKDQVTAVGLTKFRDKKNYCCDFPPEPTNYQKQVFKPNYSNNFFLL